MARSERDEPADVLTNALDLLTRDHRLIDELFTSFFAAAPQQLDPLARRLCKMLRIHTQIEEELFYPAARRVVQDRALIEEAEREHAQAKEAVRSIESMTSDHAEFRSRIEALRDKVAAHIAEEESDLFPKLRDTKLDLTALGIALAERRDTLMDVLGLHGDDEEGAANMREVQRARSAPPRPSAQR